eukprot:14212677-Ditylum_brightwellii.AAC.1
MSTVVLGDGPGGTTLVDAHNGFNELSRDQAARQGSHLPTQQGRRESGGPNLNDRVWDYPGSSGGGGGKA